MYAKACAGQPGQKSTVHPKLTARNGLTSPPVRGFPSPTNDQSPNIHDTRLQHLGQGHRCGYMRARAAVLCLRRGGCVSFATRIEGIEEELGRRGSIGTVWDGVEIVGR